MEISIIKDLNSFFTVVILNIVDKLYPARFVHSLCSGLL